MGKKKQPVYKVVAADARSPRDGRFIEAIGFYNPQTNPATIDIKEDRANYWLNVGAQPTDTVKSLFSKKGIILQRELTKQGLSEDKIAAKMDEWKKMQEAKVAASEKKKLEKKAKAEQQAKAEEEAKAKAEAEAQAKAEAEAKAAEVKEEAVEETKEEAKAPEAEVKAEDNEPEVKGTASEEAPAEEKKEN